MNTIYILFSFYSVFHTISIYNHYAILYNKRIKERLVISMENTAKQNKNPLLRLIEKVYG